MRTRIALLVAALLIAAAASGKTASAHGPDTEVFDDPAYWITKDTQACPMPPTSSMLEVPPAPTAEQWEQILPRLETVRLLSSGRPYAHGCTTTILTEFPRGSMAKSARDLQVAKTIFTSWEMVAPDLFYVKVWEILIGEGTMTAYFSHYIVHEETYRAVEKFRKITSPTEVRLLLWKAWQVLAPTE